MQAVEGPDHRNHDDAGDVTSDITSDATGDDTDRLYARVRRLVQRGGGLEEILPFLVPFAVARDTYVPREAARRFGEEAGHDPVSARCARLMDRALATGLFRLSSPLRTHAVEDR